MGRRPASRRHSTAGRTRPRDPSLPKTLLDMAKQLVWLITGTSYDQFSLFAHPNSPAVALRCRTGLGRDLTLAALQRGDKVIATARARSFAKLDDLEQQGADVLEMDVTAPLETLHEVAKKAVAIHGRVDVVVNNAGEALGVAGLQGRC